VSVICQVEPSRLAKHSLVVLLLHYAMLDVELGKCLAFQIP
jgi:hypothetical protein